MGAPPRLFLDTSALFAGIWSPGGGARLILQMGEAGAVQVVVSRQVLSELETALRRKAPHLLPVMALLLDRLQPEIAPPALAEQVQTCLAFTGHPGDAQVLADAWQAGVDYLVSLDQQHILDNVDAAAALPFSLGTPGDFIQAYRGSLS